MCVHHQVLHIISRVHPCVCMYIRGFRPYGIDRLESTIFFFFFFSESVTVNLSRPKHSARETTL